MNYAMRMSLIGIAGAQALANGLLFAGFLFMNKGGEQAKKTALAFTILAGALYGASIAWALMTDPSIKTGLPGLIAGAAIGAVVAVKFTKMMADMMAPPMDFDYEPIDWGTGGLDFDKSMAAYGDMAYTGEEAIANFDADSMDMGGRFIPTYDTGGYSSEHGMAILQRGETVTSKTSNMLGGGGTVIHIHGDVYDEEKFVEKVAEVMGPVVRQTAMLNVRSM
jgi:hypothetical protein